MRNYLILIATCCIVVYGCSSKPLKEEKLQATKTTNNIEFKISRLQQAIENEDVTELEKLKSKIHNKQPFKSVILRKRLKGAQKTVRTRNVYPLIWAVYCHKKKSVEKLLNLGASVNVYDLCGYTPLARVVDEDNYDNIDIGIFNLLIKDKKLNPNIATDSGDSALSLTIENKNYKIAEILLKSGSNPNFFIRHKRLKRSEDDTFDSLLYLCLENNDLKMFNLLLKYGANINLQDENDNTLLDDMIKEDYNKKYISFLKKHGAKTAAELKAEKKKKDTKKNTKNKL